MTGSHLLGVNLRHAGLLPALLALPRFRDAEDRAAQEIAENINTRLASFFTAGT